MIWRPALALLLTFTLCPPSQGKAPREAIHSRDSSRLATLEAQDQRDRQATDIDWETVATRDQIRRGEVLRLLKQGRLRTAQDHYRAALIFQHGESLDDTMQAFALARMAMSLDPRHPSAAWLAAAAWDRSLLLRQKTQWYGTQYELDEKEGTLTLSPVEDAAVSDDERKTMGLPSLSEARARHRRAPVKSH